MCMLKLQVKVDYPFEVQASKNRLPEKTQVIFTNKIHNHTHPFQLALLSNGSDYKHSIFMVFITIPHRSTSQNNFRINFFTLPFR